MVLDVDNGIATYEMLGIDFNLSFQHAASGLPDGIVFDKADFVHPRRQTVTVLVLTMCSVYICVASVYICVAFTNDPS